MRHTPKSLQKLRSGQCVYRILFNYCLYSRSITYSVTQTWVIGKKVTHMLWSGHKFVCMGFAPWDPRCKGPVFDYLAGDMRVAAAFLGDLEGGGCFSKRHQAVRYAEDVVSGLYPVVSESLRHCALADHELRSAIGNSWDE